MTVHSQSLVLAAVLGVSVSTAAVCLYLLYRKEEDDYFAVKALKPTAKHPVVLQVCVPKEVVGGVIGAQGCNINQIQEVTNTRINFKDEETVTERIAIIKGTRVGVHEAQQLILRAIKETSEIFTEDMPVPLPACRRVIGKNGDTLRMMSRTSGAKITIHRDISERNSAHMRNITIKGTSDQISLAKALITEKLQEEEAFRLKLLVNNKDFNLELNLTVESREQTEAPKRPTRERLVPTATDGFLETTVASVDNPGHFWLQPVGPIATEYDAMDQAMSRYYSDPPNQLKHRITGKLKVGDLVAAMFNHEDWFRAEVVGVEEHETSPDLSRVRLYYVDFGDTRTIPCGEVCHLKHEFLVLPMQAVECYIANVKPVGGVWSEAATDHFDRLTYSKEWKLMMARPISYAPAPANSQSKHMVAVVELVDTNGMTDLNVGAELVKLGVAEWDTPPSEDRRR